ncbi:MAG: helix-turn-helix domain-containing protein [Ruminococcus sp.]|nr:helix-turn-helix domain-containing protein [Ruminococcus sp.]
MEVIMTTNRKNELIAQLVSILSELIETNDSEQVADIKPDAVEMLTVKECTEAVKGLSEHTVRKLIKQGKLPYLRAGDGVKGKMLINKADLLAYFNGQQTDNFVR